MRIWLKYDPILRLHKDGVQEFLQADEQNLEKNGSTCISIYVQTCYSTYH